MFIRSERLFLRPGWPEDSEDLLGLIENERAVRHRGDAPRPYADCDAGDFLHAPRPPLLPNFLMTVPGSVGARIVGAIGVASAGGDVVLKYWVARHHRGQSYATEAARAVVGLVRTLGHPRILASHSRDNPASGRVLEKTGFRRIVSAYQFGNARGDNISTCKYELRFDSLVDGDRDEDGDSMRPLRAA